MLFCHKEQTPQLSSENIAQTGELDKNNIAEIVAKIASCGGYP